MGLFKSKDRVKLQWSGYYYVITNPGSCHIYGKTYHVPCELYREKTPLKIVARKKTLCDVDMLYLFPDFLYSVFSFSTCLVMKECFVVCLNILFIFNIWIFLQ